MTIFVSFVIVAIVVGLILNSLVKGSRDQSFTSLGSLQGRTKAAIPQKKTAVASAETSLTGPGSRKEPASPVNKDDVYIAELRQRLLLKAMGDRGVVDRLIKYERNLDPTGTLTEWMEAAIERWERDHKEGRRW